MSVTDVRRIKVALVINSVQTGGAETCVLSIASHLSERFDAVTYMLADQAATRPTLTEAFARARLALVALRKGEVVGIWDSIWILRRRFRAERPDVVHCHLPNAVLAGGIAAFLCGIPFIIHEHQTRRFHSWKLRLALRLVAPLAALSLVYSEGVERGNVGSSQLLLEPPEKLLRRSYTVHNGIDMEQVSRVRAQAASEPRNSGAGEIHIVSVARFARWKGHRLLIEAFAIVAPQVPNARLRIVGEGSGFPEVFSEISERVRALGLSEKVSLPGASNDVYGTLARSDIFSLAFTYPEGETGESVGIAALEAMAFGLPVIVAKYDSVEEYITNGENGMVVEPRNAQALANAIVELARSPERRRALGEAAARTIDKGFNLRTIMSIYERIYELLARV